MQDDTELIRQFRNGDESSYDELVKRYRQRVYSVVYRLVRNTEDAYELAQDTFVRAYRALPAFKGNSSFYTWLYRIAVNLAINFLRKRKSQANLALSETVLTDEIGDTLPSARTPASDHRQARLRESIDRAVNALPDRQRLVFIMRQYEDLGNEEIAAVLQCPVGTVKANYFFAIRKMREALAEWI